MAFRNGKTGHLPYHHHISENDGKQDQHGIARRISQDIRFIERFTITAYQHGERQITQANKSIRNKQFVGKDRLPFRQTDCVRSDIHHE